jgi:gentisate 1,2-dioxygenase
MIWLDGLDIPLLRMLEANFFEEYNKERQSVEALRADWANFWVEGGIDGRRMGRETCDPGAMFALLPDN